MKRKHVDAMTSSIIKNIDSKTGLATWSIVSLFADGDMMITQYEDMATAYRKIKSIESRRRIK